MNLLRLAMIAAVGFAASSKLVQGGLTFLLWIYIAFTVAVVLQERRFQKDGLQRIPNLPPSFPSGNIMDLFKGKGTISDRFVEIKRELNSPHFMKFFIGPIPHVLISSSQSFKEIFVTKSHNYIKGSLFIAARRFMGDALFNSEGENWKMHRHAINPAFKTENIKLIANETFSSHAAILVKKWNELLSNHKNMVNIIEEISYVTLDIIGEAAFGFNLNSQLTADFSQNILYHALKRMVREGILLAIPGMKYTPYSRIYRKYTNVVDKFVYAIIEKERKGECKDCKTNLLKLMVDSDLTNEELRDETFGFVLAGYETTSTAVSFAITALSLNPHIKEKVFHELDTVLKGKAPDWDDIQRLPYLKATLLETLRFYSPVQLINRECVEDDEVLGYFIPKGASVWFSPHVICRDPQLYPSPNEFLPERFLKDIDPIATQFPVFGAGRRMCIGKQFTQIEAMIILAMIYQHFDVQLEPNHLELSKVGVTLFPKYGKIMAKIHSRQN